MVGDSSQSRIFPGDFDELCFALIWLSWPADCALSVKNQSVSQSVRQSVSQSVSQSVISPSVNQSNNQSVSHVVTYVTTQQTNHAVGKLALK